MPDRLSIIAIYTLAIGSLIFFFSNCDLSRILYIVGKSKKSTFQRYLIFMVMRFVASTRVCNRLSGYSGYSDIRKNLSVRIVIKHYSEKSIIGFVLFEITGL